MVILLIIKLSSSSFIKCPITPKYTQQNTTMNDDNAAGCAAALLIMMLFGLGLLIWVVIEITGFKL